MTQLPIFLRVWVPCLLVGLFAACEAAPPLPFNEDPDRLLAAAANEAYDWTSRAPDRLSDEQIIALGYLERARLGLGSPFRLVEYALRDTRLSPPLRNTTAYALLHQTLRGRTYRVDPDVAGLLHPDAPSGSDAGRQHLRQIERAVLTAPTADAGERTLRLAYLLAEAEGLSRPAAGAVLPIVAALVADRRRAREDAKRLFAEAAHGDADPLALLQEWRRDRRFTVEQPGVRHTGTDPNESAEALRLVRSLRTLAFRTPLQGTGTQGRTLWQDSWLSPAAAARLRLSSARHPVPPQAPVAVAVELNRAQLLEQPGLTPEQKAARVRFVNEAWNEERFVAAAAVLHRSGAARGVRLPLMVAHAGVYLRPWNQEEPWLPGDAAPSGKELQVRFGLSDVKFDHAVPDAWQPYYRVLIGRALADMERVFPGVSFRGLTVRVGALPDKRFALAMHLPRQRILLLPPATGVGTLAHELAHDLDWQLARRRYAGRGAYATDYAVRGGRADRIAIQMEGLAESFARDAADSVDTPHRTRPAEVFARGTDWLVSRLLARDGRVSGYVSSFQDEALTGYGTTRGFAVDGGGVVALVTLLDEVAPVTPDAQRWLLATFGPERNLTASEMVSAIAAAGRGLAPLDRLAAIREAERRMIAVLDGHACESAAPAALRRRLQADRALVRAAAAGAIRGTVREGIRQSPELRAHSVPAATVRAWGLHRLYGAPGPADTVPSALADTVNRWLASTTSSVLEVAPYARSFDVAGPLRVCGGNPFAWRREVHSVRNGWEAAVSPVRGPFAPAATQEVTTWVTTPVTGALELSPWARPF